MRPPPHGAQIFLKHKTGLSPSWGTLTKPMDTGRRTWAQHVLYFQTFKDGSARIVLRNSSVSSGRVNSQRAVPPLVAKRISTDFGNLLELQLCIPMTDSRISRTSGPRGLVQASQVRRVLSLKIQHVVSVPTSDIEHGSRAARWGRKAQGFNTFIIDGSSCNPYEHQQNPCLDFIFHLSI